MIPSPAQMAEMHGLRAIKNLGQHFLFDLNITRKIVNYAGNLEGMNIIEIGPGPGGLTQAILEKNINKLTVIEFDERAIAGLQELQQHYPKLEVMSGDALEQDLREITPAPRVIMSNLPYNISTKLLTNWLDYADEFEFMILMFQKEVAERLYAVPRTKDYGRLSVITQWLAKVENLFDLPPSVFTPPPKVTSSVVKITPYKTPLYPADKKKMENVLRTAFGQRRKMLRSSLKPVLPDVEAQLTAIGIKPTARAEELSVEDFTKIANLL